MLLWHFGRINLGDFLVGRFVFIISVNLLFLPHFFFRLIKWGVFITAKKCNNIYRFKRDPKSPNPNPKTVIIPSSLVIFWIKASNGEIWKPDVVDEFVIGFCGHWWHPSDHHQLEEWYVFKIPHPDSDSTHCAAPLLLLRQRKRLQSPYLLLCPLRFHQCSFWEIATFMHADGHVCIL